MPGPTVHPATFSIKKACPRLRFARMTGPASQRKLNRTQRPNSENAISDRSRCEHYAELSLGFAHLCRDNEACDSHSNYPFALEELPQSQFTCQSRKPVVVYFAMTPPSSSSEFCHWADRTRNPRDCKMARRFQSTSATPTNDLS